MPNGNHSTLHSAVKEFFHGNLEHNFEGIEHDYYSDFDKGHGRIEFRECWAVEAKDYVDCFPNLSKWKNLKSIVMIYSKRIIKEKQTQQTRFYISSVSANAERLLAATRKHWGIEKDLHWVLDITFQEDESRIRKELAAENFAIMNYIAYNLIKKDVNAGSVRSKRERAAFDDAYQSTLLNQVIQL